MGRRTCSPISDGPPVDNDGCLNAQRSDLSILCRLRGIPYPELIALIMASVGRRLGSPTILEDSIRRRGG